MIDFLIALAIAWVLFLCLFVFGGSVYLILVTIKMILQD